MRTTIDAERAAAIADQLAIEADFLVGATEDSDKFLLAGNTNSLFVIQDAESPVIVMEVAAAETAAKVTLRPGTSGEWVATISGTEVDGSSETLVLQAKPAAIVSKWLESSFIENVSLGKHCTRRYLRYLYSSMLRWGSPHGGRSKNLLWRFRPTLTELRSSLLDVPTHERPLALFTGEDQSRSKLLVLATTECIRVVGLRGSIRRCFRILDPHEQITRAGRTSQLVGYCFSQPDGEESLWVGGLPLVGMLHLERLFESIGAYSGESANEQSYLTESQHSCSASPDELDELELLYALKAAKTRLFHVSGYWKLLTGLASGMLAGYLFYASFAYLVLDHLWLYAGTFMCAFAILLFSLGAVISFVYKRRAASLLAKVAALSKSASRYLVAIGLERVPHLVSIDSPFLSNLLGVDAEMLRSTQDQLLRYLLKPPLEEMRSARGLMDDA